MLRLSFFLLTLFISLCSYGQSQKRAELEIFSRYDKHADYMARYGDRTYTNGMKLWGTSGGIQFNYLQPVTKNFHLILGAGYFRLGVDKIRSTTPWSDNVSSRTIDYNHPTGIQPVFHTNKYHYNNLALSVGLNYERRLSTKSTLTFGGDYTYLYTFSQVYRITYDQARDKITDQRKLGFGLNLKGGILKKFANNRFYINPKLIVPIFQQLNGDSVFREDTNLKIIRCFNGVGFSVSFGKFL